MNQQSDSTGSSFLQEIADYFIEERKGTLWISPRDIMTILSWEQAGIPLAVAKRGIGKALSGNEAAGGQESTPVRSVSYCTAGIREELRLFRKMRVGMSAEAATEETALPDAIPAVEVMLETLQAAVEELEEGLSSELPEQVRQNLLQAARHRLERLAGSIRSQKMKDPVKLRKALRKLDDHLLRMLLESVPPVLLTACSEDAQRQLAHFGISRQAPEALRAYQNLVRSIARQRFGLSKVEAYDILSSL